MKTVHTTPNNSMRGWYSSPDTIADALLYKKMLNPMIDLSNPCNLNCPYCYIEDKNSARKKRKPHELTRDETKKIIDAYADCGAQSIDIVGAGEPTIDQHFWDIIHYIHSKGITTCLFTNGIQCTQKNFVQQLYAHDVTVILKCNSFNADIQDYMAGKKGYNRIGEEALQVLLASGFADCLPTRLAFNTLVCQGNKVELSDIHRYCREHNIFPISGDFIPTGRTEGGVFVAESSLGRFTEKEKEEIRQILQPLTSAERILLRQQLQDIDQAYGIKHSGCPSYYGGAVCTQQLGLYTDITGNIWPCVARMQKNFSTHYQPLGNIRTGADIASIRYNHPSMQHIRAHFDGGCPYKESLQV